MMKNRAQQIESKSTVNFDLYFTGLKIQRHLLALVSVLAPVTREKSVIVAAKVCV